ncbi:MAG: cytidylate kinase [Gammaproteobacteria bacterium SG8_11]|nr:MAG: cytidylate kinase [Gammaproteobacteria bacterium SG8_11]
MNSNTSINNDSQRKAPVITIDGPTASGKGTISRLLADRLGWQILDSGALYRLLGLKALRQNVPLDDEPVLAKLALELDIRFSGSALDEEIQVFLDEENVTNEIRTETSGAAASKVAALPKVRTALLDKQRAFRQLPGLIADGRDMGTVVFPDAQVKIFLTASAEERAKRRYNQLIEKGVSVNLSDLFEESAERDKRDSNRSAAPLVAAEDAVELDTSNITAEQAALRVLELYQNRTKS